MESLHDGFGFQRTLAARENYASNYENGIGTLRELEPRTTALVDEDQHPNVLSED